MSLLLYAIGDGVASAPRVRTGVGSRPLRSIGGSGLTALVSEHDVPPALDEDTLWTFERVVEAQMESGPVLPVRFGSLVSDVPALQRVLRERHRELTAQLDRIRGAAELSVRAVWSSAEADPAPGCTPHTGTAYLMARLGPQRRARALSERMRDALDDLARETRYRVPGRPDAPVSAAFLVGVDDVEMFVDRVESLRIDCAELICTGPWPAYSFVGARSSG